MPNLTLYNELRNVPKEAKKPIDAGRLKGFTNISPMWRIKRLTEVFGPCGIGWVPELVKKEVIDGVDGERVASVDVNLYVKEGGEWSKPIPGTGGSLLVAKERSGLHTSDEAFKMAYTDALSVAAKNLGLAADVYFSEDAGFTEPTKYDADDLFSHSALAIKKRIEMLMTSKINEGGSYDEMLDFIKVSKKKLEATLEYLSLAHEIERRINRYDPKQG